MAASPNTIFDPLDGPAPDLDIEKSKDRTGVTAAISALLAAVGLLVGSIVFIGQRSGNKTARATQDSIVAQDCRSLFRSDIDKSILKVLVDRNRVDAVRDRYVVNTVKGDTRAQAEALADYYPALNTLNRAEVDLTRAVEASDRIVRLRTEDPAAFNRVCKLKQS